MEKEARLEIEEKINSLKVGQIWRCIENPNIVLVSLVRPKEVRGYMFDGFQVVPYYSLCPFDFCKYWRLERERNGG